MCNQSDPQGFQQMSDEWLIRCIYLDDIQHTHQKCLDIDKHIKESIDTEITAKMKCSQYWPDLFLFQIHNKTTFFGEER